MMRWIVESSLKIRLLVVAIAAAVMAFGVVELRDSPVDMLPEFTPPTVEIQTEALGLSAAEVEQLITVPIEQDLLAGVAFLDEIRSQSVPGLSSIVLVFEPGTDILRARQVVAERMTQAHALPHVSKPPQMLQPLSSTSRVMMVGLSSDELSPIEMSVLARWTIRPRLMGVPGVANVAIFGLRERQLQVQVDPERLRDHGISLVRILETAGNALWVSPLSFVEASTPGTGGFIDTPNQRLGIQHISPIKTAADLARVSVEGTSLTLGDVATVVEDHQPLIGDANAGSGLVLVVEKFPEANTLEITRGIEGAIDALRPGMSGVTFDTTVFRPASYIEESIDNLALALIIGGALLAAAFGLFLFEWRAALIAVVVIPLSVVVAALVLDLVGETINVMVVAGLVAALGLLVTDAVADVNTVSRRLREQRADGSRASATDVILAAAHEIRGPFVYATLIVALALVPVFVLEGVPGAFFPSLAVSFLLAALASMAVALTVTPALGLILLSRTPLERRESPLVTWLQRRYARVLRAVLRGPRRAYLPVGAIVVAGLVALPFLTPALSPSLKESQLLIKWDAAPGTSLPEMNRITTQAIGELRAIPAIQNVGSHAGRAVTSDQVVGVNSSELWVSIDPAADYDTAVAAIREVVDGYPGVSGEVLTYSSERVREALTGRSEDFVVRVYGEDLDILRSKSDEVKRVLAGIDGIVDPTVKAPDEEATIEVETDLAAAQEHGIEPGDVRRAAATMLSGIEVGSLFEEQKVFEVVVQGPPAARHSLSSIRDLPIDTPTGGYVRLGDVADVRVSANPNIITRHAVSRYIDVAAGLDGRSLDAVASDVGQRLQLLSFPLGYHAEVLFPEERTPLGQLIALAVAAGIGVLLFLQVSFGSWRLAAVAFATLPLALSGGALGALANGGDLSLGSLMGFVAVLGIAARSALLVIRYIQQLEERGGETPRRQLVVRGARERLVPILAAAVATALALLPLVALGAIPGYELLSPLAAVVLGGLVTSTLIALFVLPTLYMRFATPMEHEAAFTMEELTSDPGRRARRAAKRRQKAHVPTVSSDESQRVAGQGSHYFGLFWRG
jgi:CzcA family heavy metal efflux pump